jgi:UDP-N-acetylmuramyl pentapeptide phosphotransferase/UDP-N-acetylglucosamine-1-phosphate transferase
MRPLRPAKSCKLFLRDAKVPHASNSTSDKSGYRHVLLSLFVYLSLISRGAATQFARVKMESKMEIIGERFVTRFDSAVVLPEIHPDVLRMFVFAMLTSMLVSALIVITQRWHGTYSFDKDLDGIQKVHTRPVPRTGGVALMVGMLMAPLLGMSGPAFDLLDVDGVSVFKLLFAATPALLAGLFEDLTKSGSVRIRLLATFASALSAAWLLGAFLPRLDILVVDDTLRLLPVSVAVTVFAVAGVTNSINILDGFHGVAGGAAAVALAGLSLLAWQVGDAFVLQLALVGIGATLGFLALNYPTGRLFMGDGGAYLLGFWVAEVAVLTIVRNPAISTWQVLAICAYPVIEVVFSMYRRKFVRRVPVDAPDRLHLHSLFYRRVSCQKIPRSSAFSWLRNASVAWFVTAWMATAAVLAVSLGASTAVSVSLVLAQALGYMAFYTRLIRSHWCGFLNPPVLFGWRAEQRSKPV